ncbi:hypothetical protein BH24CHL5_BH24CHL5_01470 [soil metagenome]
MRHSIDGASVTGDDWRVTTHVSDLPAGREFPKEPYPGLSLIAVVLLAAAMLLFLAFFGLVGVFLGGSPTESRIAFAALTSLAIGMPLVGIRALFGNHVYSQIALTALGLLFLVGGYVAEGVAGAPLTNFAVGPVLLVLAVSAFGWWKWATKSRYVDWRIGGNRSDEQAKV